VGRLVMGAGEALLFSASLPWALRGTGPGQRGRVAGRFGLSMWSGLAIGPVMATVTHALGGGTATWWLVLATAAASTVVSLSTPRTGRWDTSASMSSLRWSNLIPAGSRLPGLYLGAAGYGYGSVITLAVAYLIGRGLPTAPCLPVFAGCFLVTRAVGSPFVDRLGPIRVCAALGVLEAVALGTLPTTSQGFGAIVVVGLAGVGVALAYPCAAALTLSRVPAASGGQAVGAMTSWWDLGLFAAGVVGGPLVDRLGYGAAFSVAAAASIVGVVAVRALQPTGWLAGSRRPA
jgi:predicted MFS family arabinose efflux permease